MRDLVADEGSSHFRIVHSLHSCTGGWVEERKGVCVCVVIWGEEKVLLK